MSINLIPLINLLPKEKGIIKKLFGSSRINKRLIDLGLSIGAEIQLLNKGIMRGPVILLIKKSKLVIGRGIAQKILVQPL